VGAADVALGRVLDRLEAVDALRDATIAVVADHGISTMPPDLGRDATPRNVQGLLRIPMFVKAPGQAKGEVVDDPAMLIDLLPTLVDLLDVEVDWTFVGHSLADGSTPRVAPRVGTDVGPLFEAVRRQAARLPVDGGWAELAAVGEHARLVGRSLRSVEIGADSQLAWSADGQEHFGRLPTADGRRPQVLTGAVETGSGVRPPDLVVAVNGTIAGVISGYERDGDEWRFTSVLGPYLRDGANAIEAFEVDGGTLRRLAR
jgi:hypothetical protein